jgi:hypothetical protein
MTTQQHKYLVCPKNDLFLFYFVFCSPKVSATKAEMPIKKIRPFLQTIYFMAVLWQWGGGG